MARRFALALTLLAVACTKSSGPAPTEASTAAPPAATTAAPLGPGSAEPATSAEAPSTANSMPSELHASSSQVAGCLASPGGTEQAPRARAMDPGAKKPELSVTVVADGVLVAHDLSHACCLKSKIETAVSDKTVTITETLSGTPCRCMCSSTISTSVRLSPGDYTLKVVVDENGQKKTSEQKLVVK